MKMLGTQTETPRGFGLVLFDDANCQKCSLQQSSAIGDANDACDRPGSSFVWLGVDSGNPGARMHLDREQVTGLIERLQAWVVTGDFGLPMEAADAN